LAGETAETWGALHTALAENGFALGFRSGRLMLTDSTTKTYICSCRFLGAPLQVLSDRLGKPKARVETQCGQGRLVG